MSRITSTSHVRARRLYFAWVTVSIAVFGLVAVIDAHATQDATLSQPLKSLFRHSKHEEAFKKLGVSCVDCHTFSIKQKEAGPITDVKPDGYIQAPRGVCHQCHLGNVQLPRPNQCLLCHAQTDTIKPKDHFLGWRERHGKMAQMNRESCTQCHTDSSCSKCHLKTDRMNPQVHRPNFRITHSIHARANPQSCIECHKSPAFCRDCHYGGKR